MDFISSLTGIDQDNLQLILIASAAVFLGDLVANIISFSNRFVNALLLAVIAAVALIAAGNFVTNTPLEELWLPAAVVALLGFVVGYLGNILAFGNRFVNALVTGIVFLILAGVGFHVLPMITA